MKNTKSIEESFLSNDKKKILKTLKAVEQSNNPALMVHLIKLGQNNADPEIQMKIRSLLFNQKLTKSQALMLDELKAMPAHPFRATLLAAIWNASIPILDRLEMIVAIAINGSLEEAIECLTIIEEAEGAIDEVQIMDSLILLNNYKNDETRKKEAKNPIIEEIFEKIQHLERTHQ